MPPLPPPRWSLLTGASLANRDLLTPLSGPMKALGIETQDFVPAALKNAKLKWDDATLDKWIAAPMAMVPGTMMSFPGLKDPAKRAEIIAYLKTLR